jgi:hypothetical protein
MQFNPRGSATAIGSLPHQDLDRACDLILETIPEIPAWPQLPNIDFHEWMDIQYSEGLPRLVLDEGEQKIFFKTEGDFSAEFEKFYENFLADHLDYFQISRQCSRGIYALADRLSAPGARAPVAYLKSQIAGPVTFGLTVQDEHKKAIYYNEVFRDVVVKGLTMKARWMIGRFAPLGLRQICFVDEPVLAAFGSSTYVSVQRADVVGCLREVIEALHKDSVLTGSHCCGNTDWTILIDAGFDIINFDAYAYGETIAYYADQVREFLEKGGVLAWGIVPTSEQIAHETPRALVQKLSGLIDHLAGKGIPQGLLWDRCLLTPSCGTGSLSVDQAEQVMYTLAEVSSIVRGK